MKINIFWFRRDLRLHDNRGLAEALNSKHPVIPLFIFDQEILEELPENDARVSFIYDLLSGMNQELASHGSSLLIKQGKVEDVWNDLLKEYEVEEVFWNRDYEPQAIERDKLIDELLSAKSANCHDYKDQVIFEMSEVTKDDGKPYTVYTPYKNKWFKAFSPGDSLTTYRGNKDNFHKRKHDFPYLKDLGFTISAQKVEEIRLNELDNYSETRNFPAQDSTSYLSPHLRFGSVSIREIIRKIPETNVTFIQELIWREFFMQILFHFPRVVDNNFRVKYDGIQWRNNEGEFAKWCEGKTGYPMVDAGMRQLNETGYMHNRVRMVTAGFLCKHLLIDWKWGEAYFAEKLLDYELSSNNGNWQWAAGTGCDAAPYFRIFNPITQLSKFDPKNIYTRKHLPELDTFNYPLPMVEHKMARQRALDAYKIGIAQS